MYRSHPSSAPSRPLPLSLPPKPAWSSPYPTQGNQPPHIYQTRGYSPLPVYTYQPVSGHLLSPSNYFSHVPLNPIHPPPLPMDPANPRLSSSSPVRTRGSRGRRISPSSGGPPKAVLGGPGGRPFGEFVTSSGGEIGVETPSSARAESPRTTESKGRSVVVKLPVEPYKTTWDLMQEDWVARRRLVADNAGPEDIPLPLSPLPKGTTWPTRTPLFGEVEEPAVNADPAESLETVDPMEVRAVTEAGMVRGRCEVRIPDNTAWLDLIQDAADRLRHGEDLQVAKENQGIFRKSKPVDNRDTTCNLGTAHDGQRPGHGFTAPSAPRLTAVRNLSDRPSLVHPSPARSQFQFRQLTGFMRRSSAEYSPILSPLALPESRTTRSKSPVRQLFKAAVIQIRDQPVRRSRDTINHRPPRRHSQVGHSSVLSIDAPPFVPRGESTMSAIRPAILSKGAAAYLPSWAKPALHGVPSAPSVVPFETTEGPQEFTYPTVYQCVGPQVTASIMRNRSETTTFGQLPATQQDTAQVLFPHSRGTNIVSDNHQHRESFVTEESDTVLYSQERWAVSIHVDVASGESPRHYDPHEGFDRRSVGEFSNPSDEEDYLRHRSEQRAASVFHEACQWSSTPGESLNSADSFGAPQRRRAKRHADDSADSLSLDEGETRSKARLKRRVRAGRARGGREHQAPAKKTQAAFESDVEAYTMLNPLAKPFVFGASRPFSFLSPLHSHASRLDTDLPEPSVTVKEVSTCAPKTQRLTDTCVAANDRPLHPKRALHADTAKQTPRAVPPLSETSLRNHEQGVAPGSRHTAPAGSADTDSLAVVEHEQEEMPSTVVNNMVRAGSLFAEGDDAPFQRTCTPLSAAIALTPRTSSRAPSPVPAGAPVKAAEEREVQKDIMINWRFPVPPDGALEPLATSSEWRALDDRQGNKVCDDRDHILASTEVSKRTRMPIPSFERIVSPAGLPCDKLDEHWHSNWLGDKEAGTGTTGTTGTTVTANDAVPVTDNPQGDFQRQSASMQLKGISRFMRVSAGGDRAERLQAAADASQDTDDESRHKAFRMSEFEVGFASCIKTSIEEAVRGLGLTGNGSRVDQFMERTADVLEQQSQLLLGVTSRQRAHEVSDGYPQVKTHTEDLIGALITGQHTLLEQIGNMQNLRELLQGTPAAISQAVKSLDTAQQEVADKEALLTSLQNTRAEYHTYRQESGEQLAMSRTAHGQVLSELEYSQNGLSEARVERDGLRQDLEAVKFQMRELQETYSKANFEVASSTSALLVIGSEKDALMLELAQMKQAVHDQHVELDRLRSKSKDGGAIMEGMAGTVASLANQVSSDASAAVEFRQKTTDHLELIAKAILTSQARESQKSLDSSVPGQVQELQDANTTLQTQLAQATARANKTFTEHACLSERVSATQKQVEERDKAIRTLQRDLETSCLEVQRQQHAAQDALVKAARSDGHIEACKSREYAVRQQYSVLHRWAEQCRRALERSEAMRSQPFVVRDSYTGDYAEVVTRWNRKEELTLEPSNSRSSTASSAIQTLPRVIVKSRSLPDVANALASASPFQQTWPSSGEVEGNGSIKLSEDGWWRKE